LETVDLDCCIRGRVCAGKEVDRTRFGHVQVKLITYGGQIFFTFGTLLVVIKTVVAALGAKHHWPPGNNQVSTPEKKECLRKFINVTKKLKTIITEIN
jgi:hypothetical protein